MAGSNELIRKCTVVAEFIRPDGAVAGKNIPCQNNRYGECLLDALKKDGYTTSIQSGRCEKHGTVAHTGEPHRN